MTSYFSYNPSLSSIVLLVAVFLNCSHFKFFGRNFLKFLDLF